MDNKKITDSVLSFLSEEDTKKKKNITPPESEVECDEVTGVCIIKGDKSLIERINKKVITEDGRELLI
tara:strand:+ start:46000 stop:46203 length:204 start_codon:yes stop_codon:yes gene_type:complete